MRLVIWIPARRNLPDWWPGQIYAKIGRGQCKNRPKEQSAPSSRSMGLTSGFLPCRAFSILISNPKNGVWQRQATWSNYEALVKTWSPLTPSIWPCPNPRVAWPCAGHQKQIGPVLILRRIMMKTWLFPWPLTRPIRIICGSVAVREKSRCLTWQPHKLSPKANSPVTAWWWWDGFSPPRTRWLSSPVPKTSIYIASTNPQSLERCRWQRPPGWTKSPM